MAAFNRRKYLKLKRFVCQLYANERKRKGGREARRDGRKGGKEEDSSLLVNQ